MTNEILPYHSSVFSQADFCKIINEQEAKKFKKGNFKSKLVMVYYQSWHFWDNTLSNYLHSVVA